MKHSTRIFVILLCLCTLLTAVSCNNDTAETQEPASSRQESSSETVSETQREEDAVLATGIEKKDYDDILYLQCYHKPNLDLLWTEKSDQSVVSEAIYDRQIKLRDHIGVEIIGTPTAGTHLTYHEAFCTSQKNKDGAVDLFITSPYTSIPMLIKEGYVREFNDVPGVNIRADYWNYEFMDTLNLFGKHYLGYSDFNVAKVYVLSFNKVMLEKYADALDESIYDTVRGYRWTIDKMTSLANLVYIDATGDGKTADDTFGITGQQWIPYLVFMQSSSIPLVAETEAGAMEVSVLNDTYKERTATLVDKLKALAKSNSAWFRYREEDTPMIGLESERTLMALTKTEWLEKYLDYSVEFGVLPYPMFDEAQKDIGYRALNFDGYTTVPAYLENDLMVGETLELLSFYSEPVRIAVFEKMLGKQVADSPDDSAMLDIVWDSVCSDFGVTYSHLHGSLDNNMYMLPQVTNPNGTYELVSFVNGYTKAANKVLKQFMTNMSKK